MWWGGRDKIIVLDGLNIIICQVISIELSKYALPLLPGIQEVNAQLQVHHTHPPGLPKDTD